MSQLVLAWYTWLTALTQGFVFTVEGLNERHLVSWWL